MEVPNLALVETKQITVQCSQSEGYDPLPANGSRSGSGAYCSGPNTGSSASGTHFLPRLYASVFPVECEGKGEYVVVVVLRRFVVVDIGHRDPLPVKESM